MNFDPDLIRLFIILRRTTSSLKGLFMYFKCLFVKRTYFIVITFIFIPSREEAHLFSPYKKFTHYVFFVNIQIWEHLSYFGKRVYAKNTKKYIETVNSNFGLFSRLSLRHIRTDRRRFLCKVSNIFTNCSRLSFPTAFKEFILRRSSIDNLEPQII